MTITPTPIAADDLSGMTLDERVEQFRAWARTLVLDTKPRRPWELEPFQVAFVRDYLRDDITELWLVVPEGNAKTTLTAGIALHHLIHTTAASVPVAASSRDQAVIMFGQADGFITRSPSLRGRFKSQEGYRRIVMGSDLEDEAASRLQVYAADEKTGDGVIPTLPLIDELHRHRSLGLYRTWRGKLDKRGAKLIVISTAGEPGSEFEEVRARMLTDGEQIEDHGAYIRAEGFGTVIHDYAVRRREQCSAMKAVKAANPLAQITEESLSRKYNSPSRDDAHWQRLTCNVATRIGGTAITPEQWDRLAEPGVEADRKAWCIGWVDLGWRIDCTAVGILVWESEERRVLADVRIFEPPVSEHDVAAAILELEAGWHPFGFVYDPNAGGFQMAEQLDAGRHILQVEGEAGRPTFIEHSQDNALMTLAASRYDEAIRNGWLVHDGDRVLRRHHLNAVRRDVGGEKWRYDRPSDAKGERRRRYPIDALTGAAMGNSVAYAEHLESNASPYETRDLIVI